MAACAKEAPPTPKTSDFATDWKPAVKERVEPGALFIEVREAAGIDFVHINGAAGKKLLPETMGSGVGMLDYDLDGDLDLLFVQSRPWTGDAPTMRLFRNEGGWKFKDATAGSGLEVPCYGMGCAIADYDADGDPDVYVTALGPNLLFRNDGGRFVRVDGPDGGTWTDAKGAVHPAWSTGAAWYDADGDDDLDLLVVNYVRWTEETDVPRQLVEDRKAYTRPELYEGDGPRLYLQEEGRFRDATEESGLAATKVKGKSLGICLDDFDGDGRTDIFVANDTVQNFLFLAQGPAKYVEVAVAAAVGYDDSGRARAGMGIDAVDWRNDGKLAVAIGNFSEEPVSLHTVSRAQPGTSVLFEDAANDARIGHLTLLPLTFGLLWCDVDLDGWCDLVLANGHIEPTITRLKAELQYAQSPQLFRNLEGKRFAEVSAEAGLTPRIVGRGLASGDLDGDGDLDLVFTSNGGHPLVLRNDLASDHRALRLRLRQPATGNVDALGAVVTVTAGGVTQRRFVRTGGSYLSQGDPALTFGLGKAARAERVTVRWPDGTEQEFGPRDPRPAPHPLERKP